MKRLALFPKLMVAFLAVSLPPLIWLSLDAAIRIGSVGSDAVLQATRTLDARAGRALEMQAVEVAGELGRFLEERLGDLSALSALPKTPEVFKAFSAGKRGLTWSRSRAGGGTAVETRESLPLYSEAAFIAPSGREVLRVEGDSLCPTDALRNVATAKDTAYGVEDYFARVALLRPGAQYVGRLVGYHVSKSEQLAGAATPEEALDGARYRGHIRFAQGVWEGGRFLGVVTLALDHRHLMEFTQHLLPLSNEKVLFPSYQSGDYAFLFDDEGWIITHPKYWDIRGFDRQGRPVPAYSERSTKEDIEAGRIPFRLDEAGFVDPNYPLAAGEVRAGRSGVTRTSNVAGVDKVMAYAPIRFPHGEYARWGVFGGVTIGSKTEGFHSEAARTGEEIDRASRLTLGTGVLLTIFLGCAVAVAAFFLSRTIAEPIHKLALMARKISAGNLSARADAPPGDEVGDLAADFNYMAALLEEKERKLISSLTDLGRSRDDAQAYAGRLEEQVRLFGIVQAMGEFLGTTFERERVLGVLLDNAVRGLGFDRAAIYITEGDGMILGKLAEAGSGAPGDELPPVLPVGGDTGPALAAEARRMVRGGAPGGRGYFVCVPMVIRDSVVGALVADTVASGRDISEQAAGTLAVVGGQAARAIERARLFEEVMGERRFVEAVVSSVATGLVTLDHAGRISSINPYAKNALGPDALLGRTLEECGLPEELCDWVGGILAGAQGEPEEFELAAQGAPATMIWVPSRFESAGGSGLILQFRDITAEKTLSREMERVDRLASLGRLAAGVAHEVRNPLTGVSLLLDDLHDRLKADHDRELVARALMELERLEGLVQSMLDYARVGPVTKKLLPLSEIIEGSLFLVRREALGQGVKVEVALAPDLPNILADSDKIKQALLNFCLNALQAMGGGGTLAISAAPAPDGAWVSIRDNGVGIPPKELSRIFEPFHTLRPGGSGLGLSIAHTIVTDHGGRIEVTSKVGEGTEFRVFLPGAAG